MTSLEFESRVSPTRAQHYVELGYWGDRQLRQGIEAAASERPDDEALVDNRTSLSWADLASRIAATAQTLSEHGIGRDDLAVLISGNTVEGVVAYHGLLRAGTTVVLLDRRCGSSDLRLAMESLPVSLVALPSSESERLADVVSDVKQVRLEELTFDNDASSAGWGWVEPSRDRPAVVLFTSGTTNRPKGVVHSLNTVTHAARNMAVTTGAGKDSVVYLVSPVTSITGVMQMHMTADTHSTLVLDDEFEPQQTLDRINSYGATILGGAPVIVERLVAVADARADTHISLQTLALGGTMLPTAFLDRISKQYEIDVVRVYGSSEAPNTTGRLGSDDLSRHPIDDGAIMPGSEVRVGSPAHSHEGLLRGPHLMLGYLDAHDNEESYEDDWYRTGDLVDVADGRLTVIGRLKEIVNRNGFKISLSEIDTALFGCPGVEESASFGVSDQETGERLAIAIVPRTESAVTLDDVLAYLRASGLAARKLPEQVVLWDEPLPRTASGKVVRSILAMDAPTKEAMVVDRLRRNE